MLLLVVLATVNSACSHQRVTVQTLYSSSNCAMNEATLKSIDTVEELERLRVLLKNRFSDAQPLSQVIDLSEQTLILYALGQKSSGGFSINLTSSEALIKGGTLYLPLQIDTPTAERFNTLGMVSPCQVYAIPKTSFDKIVLGS